MTSLPDGVTDVPPSMTSQTGGNSSPNPKTPNPIHSTRGLRSLSFSLFASLWLAYYGNSTAGTSKQTATKEKQAFFSFGGFSFWFVSLTALVLQHRICAASKQRGQTLETNQNKPKNGGKPDEKKRRSAESNRGWEKHGHETSTHTVILQNTLLSVKARYSTPQDSLQGTRIVCNTGSDFFPPSSLLFGVCVWLGAVKKRHEDFFGPIVLGRKQRHSRNGSFISKQRQRRRRRRAQREQGQEATQPD